MTFYEPETQRGLFANIWAWIIATLVVIGLIVAVVFVVRWLTAPARGKLQAREQIQSGAFRIQAYSHFFDLCASVTTMDQALNQTIASEKTDTGSDLSRDRVNYTAQLNDRNDAANQYNADSHKSYTVAQFKASSLPYSIPTYTKGQVFQCGS